ncbi:MAG TPA: hypothetical protein VEC99_01120 [Clostridia bacterium]|nr:hypothetical protein [Clostridia bacterium]
MAIEPDHCTRARGGSDSQAKTARVRALRVMDGGVDQTGSATLIGFTIWDRMLGPPRDTNSPNSSKYSSGGYLRKRRFADTSQPESAQPAAGSEAFIVHCSMGFDTLELRQPLSAPLDAHKMAAARERYEKSEVSAGLVE